jgi:hypothetical protein
MSRVRSTALILVLTGAGILAGCNSSSVDGQYQDSSGAVTVQLKNGKASMSLGGVLIDGSYSTDGNKITVHPVSGNVGQSVVFTVNKDASIDGPQEIFPRLQKVK